MAKPLCAPATGACDTTRIQIRMRAERRRCVRPATPLTIRTPLSMTRPNGCFQVCTDRPAPGNGTFKTPAGLPESESCLSRLRRVCVASHPARANPRAVLT